MDDNNFIDILKSNNNDDIKNFILDNGKYKHYCPIFITKDWRKYYDGINKR